MGCQRAVAVKRCGLKDMVTCGWFNDCGVCLWGFGDCGVYVGFLSVCGLARCLWTLCGVAQKIKC